MVILRLVFRSVASAPACRRLPVCGVGAFLHNGKRFKSHQKQDIKQVLTTFGVFYLLFLIFFGKLLTHKSFK
jgi:hypothetical protein